MNCNPFTKGHRYLIETALQEVDCLYLFIVEEDKSQFLFADRLDMVKLGTRDLKNVKIIPSGNFIISAQTFPEYFSKEAPAKVLVDTSKDVEIFGKYIVPALGIDIRFVGEEPFDKITEQYNMRLKELLPKYGVKVKEIPRKKVGNKVISATTLRKAIYLNDLNIISEMATKTTIDYLRMHGFIG